MKLRSLIITTVAAAVASAGLTLPAGALGSGPVGTTPEGPTVPVPEPGSNDGGGFHHRTPKELFIECLGERRVNDPWRPGVTPAQNLTKEQFTGIPHSVMGCTIPGWYQGWPKRNGELDPAVDVELIQAVEPYTQEDYTKYRPITLCNIWPFSVVFIGCQHKPIHA